MIPARFLKKWVRKMFVCPNPQEDPFDFFKVKDPLGDEIIRLVNAGYLDPKMDLRSGIVYYFPTRKTVYLPEEISKNVSCQNGVIFNIRDVRRAIVVSQLKSVIHQLGYPGWYSPTHQIYGPDVRRMRLDAIVFAGAAMIGIKALVSRADEGRSMELFSFYAKHPKIDVMLYLVLSPCAASKLARYAEGSSRIDLIEFHNLMEKGREAQIERSIAGRRMTLRDFFLRFQNTGVTEH